MTARDVAARTAANEAAPISSPHNAAPKLLAIARGVAELAEEHDEWARTNRDLAFRFATQGAHESENFHLGIAQAQEASARHLRALLADAAPDEEAR